MHSVSAVDRRDLGGSGGVAGGGEGRGNAW